MTLCMAGETVQTPLLESTCNRFLSLVAVAAATVMGFVCENSVACAPVCGADAASPPALVSWTSRWTCVADDMATGCTASFSARTAELCFTGLFGRGEWIAGLGNALFDACSPATGIGSRV